jgi:putative ABC transport system substrate-binding protein
VAVLLVAFDQNAPAVMLFRDRLRSLGDIEAESFDLMFRVADETAELPARAAEIMGLRPDVIVAFNFDALEPLRALTQTIPIVVVFITDPVALGVSTSWSSPSSNVTGISNGIDTLAGKRVELLHELLPSARAFGLVYEPAMPWHRIVLERTRAAMQALGLELRLYPVSNGNELELAQIPARAAAEGVAALIEAPSPNIVSNRAGFVAAAISTRLPTMHAFGFEAVEGAVVALGPEQAENWLRAADYVHRLLHGVPLADLPFEQSARMLLTLNLRTARAIGLDVPASVIARADEVIE